MNKYATLSILFAVVAPILSLPYPIYDMQRYRRSGSLERSLTKPLPAYGSLPQSQYDDRYLSPVGPSYPYPDDEYYVGRGRQNVYSSFGSPTYRGDYKPSPYYYQPLPSYYYDDRAAPERNPMDDLQEVIMQENERDRQRQWPIGQETWFENSRHPPKLTNTFLQNLIAYNKKIGGNREPEFDSGVEFEQDDDYFNEDTMPGDVYDAPSDYRYYENSNQRAAAPVYKSRNHYPIIEETEDEDKDDEEVRELKSLAHRGRSPIKHDQDEPYEAYAEPEQEQWHATGNTASASDNNEWQHDAPDRNHGNHNAHLESEPEYDEGSWINWDRKRSVPQKQRENIKLFALNEPKLSVDTASNVPLNKAEATKAAEQAQPAPIQSSTPTSVDYSSALGRLKLEAGHHQGQKEVLLRRPDTPIRQPFTVPLMNMLQQSAEKGKSTDEKDSSKDIFDTIKHIVSMEDKLSQVGFIYHYSSS